MFCVELSRVLNVKAHHFLIRANGLFKSLVMKHEDRQIPNYMNKYKNNICICS